MWKSGKSLREEREISPQPSVGKRRDFHRACWEKSGKEIIHRKNSTFHSPCGKNLVSKKNPLQTGVDVCGDVADVVLHIAVPVF